MLLVLVQLHRRMVWLPVGAMTALISVASLWHSALFKAAVSQFVKVTVFPSDGTVVNLGAWWALVLQPFLQTMTIGLSCFRCNV